MACLPLFSFRWKWINNANLLQELPGGGILHGKMNPFAASGMIGDIAGGAVMMDPSMVSAAIAGSTVDLNEDSLDAPPSISSTEGAPAMGTPGTPGTPAPGGKDKKVNTVGYV